jgi:hypothetical protein
VKMPIDSVNTREGYMRGVCYGSCRDLERLQRAEERAWNGN